MTDDFETLFALKRGRQIDAIANEFQERRSRELAKASAESNFNSGGTVKVLLRDELEMMGRIMRAEFDSLKETHLRIVGPLTSDLLREFGARSEKHCENGDRRLSGELARAIPSMKDSIERIQDRIHADVERVRADFHRDVEIEARELSKTPTDTPTPIPKHDFVYDIFLSFATPDADAATRLDELLRECSLRVFFSKKALRGGDPWEEVIRQALIASREICVIVSKESLRREWVLTEWGAAWALERRITPVLVDCRIDELPSRLRGKQCVLAADLQGFVEEVAARAKM